MSKKLHTLATFAVIALLCTGCKNVPAKTGNGGNDTALLAVIGGVVGVLAGATATAIYQEFPEIFPHHVEQEPR